MKNRSFITSCRLAQLYLILFVLLISNILTAKGIIFLDGLPTAGKTTLAKEIAVLHPDCVLVSSDEIAKKEGIKFAESVYRSLQIAKELADKGKTVILDSWQLQNHAFAASIREIQQDVPLYIVLVFAPLDTLLSRLQVRAQARGNFILTPEHLKSAFNRRFLTESHPRLTAVCEGLFCQLPFDTVLNSATHTPQEMAAIAWKAFTENKPAY